MEVRIFWTTSNQRQQQKSKSKPKRHPKRRPRKKATQEREKTIVLDSMAPGGTMKPKEAAESALTTVKQQPEAAPELAREPCESESHRKITDPSAVTDERAQKPDPAPCKTEEKVFQYSVNLSIVGIDEWDLWEYLKRKFGEGNFRVEQQYRELKISTPSEIKADKIRARCQFRSR